MKRALLLLLLAGCGRECEQTDRLEIVGTPAPYADVVLSVAQEHCGRLLVGQLAWVTEAEPETRMGHCSWSGGGCPMDAWVRRVFASDGVTEYDATSGALAHELGHWCLETTDELAADRWAAFVEYDARERIGAHVSQLEGDELRVGD